MNPMLYAAGEMSDFVLLNDPSRILYVCIFFGILWVVKRKVVPRMPEGKTPFEDGLGAFTKRSLFWGFVIFVIVMGIFVGVPVCLL